MNELSFDQFKKDMNKPAENIVQVNAAQVKVDLKLDQQVLASLEI